MAQGLSFTFKGLPSLEKRLAKMESKARKPVDFVFERVEDMGEEMADAAPVDTGELRGQQRGQPERRNDGCNRVHSAPCHISRVWHFQDGIATVYAARLGSGSTN